MKFKFKDQTCKPPNAETLRRFATENPGGAAQKHTRFSGGFFEAETEKRLWDSICIQPEAVSQFIAKNNAENLLASLSVTNNIRDGF